MSKIKKNIKSLKGFTLLELIVVIAIISVLLMIIVPNMTDYIRTSRIREANDQAQQIYVATQDYLNSLQTRGAKVEDYFGAVPSGRTACKFGMDSNTKDVTINDLRILGSSEASGSSVITPGVVKWDEAAKGILSGLSEDFAGSWYVEELNHSKLFPKPLRITNMEAPLTEEQVRFHFALIDAHTSDVVADEKNAKKRFMRGLDFYLVQDFASSIDDFTKSILLDDTFFPAYFMRALVRYKQLEYKKAEATMSEGATSGTTEMKKPEVMAIDYEVVKNDLDHVIQLAPDFVYGYYNRGNVSSLLKDYRAALADYDKAIELSPDFAEAYFNRGLTHIFLGNNKQGIADLSKAGELGIVSAYNIIKRFTDTRE